MGNSRSVLERFEEKYIPEPMSGCWLWLGAANDAGYGLLDIRKDQNRPAKTAYLRAHRVSYEIHKGPIPEGLIVCHTCDNPPCVNPDHLFVGTHRDNHDDCRRKGRFNEPPRRMADGRAPHSKLTYAQVAEIKVSKGLLRDVAEQYGVQPSQISNIRCGKSWPEVGPFVPIRPKRVQTEKQRKKAAYMRAWSAKKKAERKCQ